MAEEISLEQLARFTGEPEERLRDWRSRGVIGRPEDDSFRNSDIERVRLVQLLLRRGIAFDDIATARRNDTLDWFDDFSFLEAAGPAYSLGEASEMVGIEIQTLQRLREGMGLYWADDIVRQDELDLMRGLNIAVKAGVPIDAIVEIIRVYDDALSRVADAEQRLFRFYVQRPLEAAGFSDTELVQRSAAIADQLTPLIEPVILYFHRRGLTRAVREDIVMASAERAGLIKRAEMVGELQQAIVFIDLSSFTPLTEAMGDIAAARVVDRFSDIVRRAVVAWAGRVVKQIGDAFMLVFMEPRSAVAGILEVQAQLALEPQFPSARAGIHWGPVLYREGDYVGANVTIASRLASEADRNQVLVTAEVRREARDLPGVEFVRIGKRKLKGLTESLELFAVHSGAGLSVERAVDPVCGMELGQAEIAARLSLEGSERAFCSEACLRKFVIAPERYTS